MKTPSPADLDAANRLLTYEGGPGGSADECAAAAERVYEKLRVRFVSLVGSAGFQVLFARSASLTRSQYTAFGDNAAVESSAKLRERLRAQEPGAVAATAANLFAAFLSLITTFIGEQLTTQMLRSTWFSPEVSKRAVTAYTAIARPSAKDPLERLTGRQREVLQLIAEGHSSKEISQILRLSVKTVESHRAVLMERLGVRGTAALVSCAIRLLISRPES
jgi:DNA-binding CsgD family transcriptional regulator